MWGGRGMAWWWDKRSEGMMEKASVFLSGNPKVEAPHKIGKDGK